MSRYCLLLLVLLPACTSQTRRLTPAEEIWRQAYCSRAQLMPGDLARVREWAEDNHIDCEAHHD